MGQSPRPPISVLDINNSVNVEGRSPQVYNSYLQNGPYFAKATPGGPLNFLFSGFPNNALLLLFGPMNLGAASYGPTGQLDIGGPVDPSTGIPVGIQIVASGFQLTNPIDAFMTTGTTGTNMVTFTTPPFPPGVLGTMQTVTPTSTGIAISNAVQLIIE